MFVTYIDVQASIVTEVKHLKNITTDSYINVEWKNIFNKKKRLQQHPRYTKSILNCLRNTVGKYWKIHTVIQTLNASKI